MEWLISALPIGLFLLACIGMHFFMMRGMHGGHGKGGAHDMHSDQPATGAGEAERLRQLESEVTSLRQQIAAQTRSNGSKPDSASLDPAEREVTS